MYMYVLWHTNIQMFKDVVVLPGHVHCQLVVRSSSQFVLFSCCLVKVQCKIFGTFSWIVFQNVLHNVTSCVDSCRSCVVAARRARHTFPPCRRKLWLCTSWARSSWADRRWCMPLWARSCLLKTWVEPRYTAGVVALQNNVPTITYGIRWAFLDA